MIDKFNDAATAVAWAALVTGLACTVRVLRWLDTIGA